VLTLTASAMLATSPMAVVLSMRDLLNSRVPGASLFDGSKVRPVALTTTYIGREIPDVSALLASARNCAKLQADASQAILNSRT
jgi:hypothetical protein